MMIETFTLQPRAYGARMKMSDGDVVLLQEDDVRFLIDQLYRCLHEIDINREEFKTNIEPKALKNI